MITRGSTPERRGDKPVETIVGKGVAVQSVDDGAALWVKLLGDEGQRIADEIEHEGYEWSLGLETLGGVARTGVAHYRSLGDESWPRALIADKPLTQLAESVAAGRGPGTGLARRQAGGIGSGAVPDLRPVTQTGPVQRLRRVAEFVDYSPIIFERSTTVTSDAAFVPPGGSCSTTIQLRSTTNARPAPVASSSDKL